MRISQRALVILIAVFGGLLFINVVLVRQNWALRSRLSAQTERAGPIEEGKVLPSLRGLDLDGQNVMKAFDKSGRRQVFLIFGPGCSVCEATVDYWKAILKEADTKNLSFIGISVVSDSSINREFVARHELAGLPVVMVNDPACRAAYGLGFIPQTVVVDPNGKVEKNWPGGLDEPRFMAIRQVLGPKSLIPVAR